MLSDAALKLVTRRMTQQVTGNGKFAKSLPLGTKG